MVFGIRCLESGNVQKLLQIKISDSKIYISHMRVSGVAYVTLNMQKYFIITLNLRFQIEILARFQRGYMKF